MLALFTVVALLGCGKLVHKLFGHSEVMLVTPRKAKRNFWIICAAALVTHFVLMLIGALMLRHTSNWEAAKNGFELLRVSWLKSNTDVDHYMNIAEKWYVDFDPANPNNVDYLNLVFFPMFPAAIRLFNLIFRNSFISALIINAIATSLAAGMVYLTLTPVVGSGKAKYGAFAALLLPGMIFMNSPMSEPLFLLFTVTCFYFLQRRELLLAGVFAALAGFTRSLGVILAVPIAIEGISYIVQLAREGKKWKKPLALTLAALLVSTLGTLGYLVINKTVTGDWFKFLEYQRTNWYQSFCPFFETARYVSNYLSKSLLDHNASMIMLWLLTLVSMFGSLTLIGANRRRLPATYYWFFLPYFAVSTGCTWLLSAVRYLSAALPIPAAISFSFNKKLKTALIFAVLLALYIGYMYMYMLRWDVY